MNSLNDDLTPGMLCRVYHSTERGYRYEEWVPEAPLELVDEYVLPIPQGSLADMAEPPMAVLELIYRDQNAVDGTERCCRQRIRSLSKGDVVMLDGRAYAVAMLGFEEIDPEAMNTPEARAAKAGLVLEV